MSYRYIGNKSRLAARIVSEIQKILPRGGVVADLMCGTASVAEALRVTSYKVLAADIMTYSVHHARVRLTLDAPPPFEGLGNVGYFRVLDRLATLKPFKGYMYREYSPHGNPLSGDPPRSYFTPENAQTIDAITKQLNDWEDQDRLRIAELSLLRHDLILATNRVANIAGTYGHFRSSWSNGSTNKLKLLPSDFIWGYPCDHIVMQGPAERIAGIIEADLCYLDPPYMKRQYAANYHLIETIARGDEPEAVGVSGLRPWRDQYSDFCSKVRIRDSFRTIIGSMRCPHFLISYSEDGLLKEEQMVELLAEFGKVKVLRIPLQRFKSNAGGQGGLVTEFLFHLKKRQG